MCQCLIQVRPFHRHILDTKYISVCSHFHVIFIVEDFIISSFRFQHFVPSTAESLSCWECVGNEGEECADYFNTTDIRRRQLFAPSYQNYQPGFDNQGEVKRPKEKQCVQSNYYIPNQVPVCQKKVQTGKYDDDSMADIINEFNNRVQR